MCCLQSTCAVFDVKDTLAWHRMSDGGVLCRRPSQPSRSVPVAVQCLARLLREAPARALFMRASGASLLAPLLRSATSGSGAAQAAPSHQLLYEAGLCAWQLTFYHPAAQAMASSRITPALVNLARHAQKEKVSMSLAGLGWGLTPEPSHGITPWPQPLPCCAPVFLHSAPVRIMFWHWTRQGKKVTI